MNNQIPKAKGFDKTICLLRTGYPFIPNQMKELQTDIFQTRLMCKKAICITGKEAAELFYDQDYFIRHGANPMRVQKTLFGVNAIQGMDGDAHIDRRKLFLNLLTPDRINQLKDIVICKLNSAVPRWKRKESINLFKESASILCESACEWCDVPISQLESRKRAQQFMTMVYAIGAVGPMYWKGKAARKSTEHWIESIIKDIRNGSRYAKEESALYQISNYCGPKGKQLSDHAAAIELINVIRPIVAVSIYITFSALALHDHPQYNKQLIGNNEKYYEMFVQEVRRFYPVGPFLGARTKKDFNWHGYSFKKGILVFLDVYGMNSSPKLWKYPDQFNPDNFLDWENNGYELIPQGGGDIETGHRCPGERLTIELMKVSVDFLMNQIQYTVPEQDLHYSLKRIPTLPASGFLIKNIRKIKTFILYDKKD